MSEKRVVCAARSGFWPIATGGLVSIVQHHIVEEKSTKHTVNVNFITYKSSNLEELLYTTKTEHQTAGQDSVNCAPTTIFIQLLHEPDQAPNVYT